MYCYSFELLIILGTWNDRIEYDDIMTECELTWQNQKTDNYKVRVSYNTFRKFAVNCARGFLIYFSGSFVFCDEEENFTWAFFRITHIVVSQEATILRITA